MTRVALVAIVVAVIAAQQPPPVDRPAPAPAPFACDDCPDPKRPWMRGSVEILCTAPETLQQTQQEHEGHRVVACGKCQHRCDPFDEQAEVTDRRVWDPQCSARCSPRGCSCKHPCDS